VLAIRHRSHHPTEHRVAKKLEPLVAWFTADLGAPTAMRERTAQQCGIGEVMIETVLQVSERSVGQQVTQLPLTRP